MTSTRSCRRNVAEQCFLHALIQSLHLANVTKCSPPLPKQFNPGQFLIPSGWADTLSKYQFSTSLQFCTLLAAPRLKMSRKDHSAIKRGKMVSLASSFLSCLLYFCLRELSQQLSLNSATAWLHDAYFPHCLQVNTPFSTSYKTQHKLVLFATKKHQQS